MTSSVEGTRQPHLKLGYIVMAPVEGGKHDSRNLTPNDPLCPTVHETTTALIHTVNNTTCASPRLTIRHQFVFTTQAQRAIPTLQALRIMRITLQPRIVHTMRQLPRIMRTTPATLPITRAAVLPVRVIRIALGPPRDTTSREGQSQW